MNKFLNKSKKLVVVGSALALTTSANAALFAADAEMSTADALIAAGLVAAGLITLVGMKWAIGFIKRA
jgi:hypothetical protein